MRTSDFTTKPSSKIMNETLNKKFGEKLDIENYSDEQLTKAAGLIESRIAVLKKGKFNETLESEEFHRLKLMQDIVKTAISERKLTGPEKKKTKEIAHAMKRDNPNMPDDKKFRIATAQAKKVAEAKKDQDGDGKKNFDDVQIARMTAGGVPKKKAIAKAKSDNYKESVNEISSQMKTRAVDAALAKGAEAKKTGWNKKGEEKKGKKADAARDTFRKKTDQAGRIVSKMKESVMKESYEYLYEGEEGKAELIMAVKDMVDKFTGWSEDIAQMQAQTAMEMADAIRNEMGSDQAEAFTAAVQPALDAAFQSVKSAREALNSTVGTLTGEAPTPMGAEPGMDNMSGEMPVDTGMDMDVDAEVPGDDTEVDVDVSEPEDRIKRESIERRLRLTKLLVGR